MTHVAKKIHEMVESSKNFETLLIHRLDETKQNAFQFNLIELITYYLSMLR